MSKRNIQKVVQEQRRREWVGNHEVFFIRRAEPVRTLSLSEITKAATEAAILQKGSTKER